MADGAENGISQNGTKRDVESPSPVTGNAASTAADFEEILGGRSRHGDANGRSQNPKNSPENARIMEGTASKPVRDSGGETDSENGSTETVLDSAIPGGDSSDSGHDSNGLDDEDGSGCSKNDEGIQRVKKISDGAIENGKIQSSVRKPQESDVEIIKNAMKNIKLVSKNQKDNESVNSRVSPVESKNKLINTSVEASSKSMPMKSNSNNNSLGNTDSNVNTNSVCNTSTNGFSNTNRRTDNRSTNNSSNSSNTNTSSSPISNTTSNTHNKPTNSPSSISTNTTSSTNRAGGDTNSTNSQDDTSSHFTIIHDLPRESACKKCPQVPGSWKQWWRLCQNLFPRARYTGRIAAVIAGSALLLLTVFLLARIPSSPDDVSQPTMYDLPDDDAFRPPGQALHRLDGQKSNLQQLLLHRHDRIGPPPGSEAHLRELARRHGVALHPELGVPVDEEYIKLEKDRKFKLAQMRAAAKKKDMKEVLEMVKDTIEDERSLMKDKEKFWSKDVTPLRILLVSTWRSGSTFLGQAILQHPGVFEHYEPFSYAGIRQIRSGTEAFQSQQFLHRLLECRFSGQDVYLNYTRQHPQDMIGHNKRIWGPCSKTRRVDLCSNATFLTEACNMFPIQLVKSVRLRLNLTQLFLGETRLNAKVIFLIRDPRATMNSRRSSVAWCEDSPDCSSPEILCSDLREDLKVAAALERLYPNSFTMLRYEDLANDPQNVLKKLFDFLGMYYSKTMADFVSKHTESEVEKPWSIARKSAARVSRWKEKMKPQDIQEIESVCKTVIEKLDYELVGQK